MSTEPTKTGRIAAHFLSRHPVRIIGMLKTIVNINIVLTAAANAVWINGPISSNATQGALGSTAVQLPDGSDLGEPGVIIRPLTVDENAGRLMVVVGGRVSSGQSDVQWSSFGSQISLYSTNTTGSGAYFAGTTPNGPTPQFVINLGAAEDANGNAITFINDGNDNFIPNTAVHSGTGRTNPLEANNYAFYYDLNLTQAQTDFLRQDSQIITFQFISDFASEGGGRVAGQNPGNGQIDFNPNNVFNSFGQNPATITDSASYAIALEVVPEPEVFAIVRGVDMAVGVTSVVVGATNWIEAAGEIAGPWSTVATWEASSPVTNLIVPSSNTVQFFRVKTLR